MTEQPTAEQPTFELDQLTDVERMILRHAVLDVGRGIYASPMIGRSVDNVGRYLAEGGEWLPTRHWTFVWRCVAQLIGREPHLLEGPAPTQKEVIEAQRLRDATADAALVDALTAFRAGEWVRALAAIDRAELASPLYWPSGRSYQQLRGYVRTERAAAEAKAAGVDNAAATT